MLATWRRTMGAVLGQPDRTAHALLLRDSTTFTRTHFLHAAGHLGLLAELNAPHSAEVLAERLGVERKAHFELLLKLGVSLGELGYRNGKFRLTGTRARALVGTNGSILRALIDEQVGYHGSVFRELPDRLRGMELGDYLADTAAVVAESSRIAEPVISGYLRAGVQEASGTRVLDAGCGSGTYLRAAAAKPGTTGTGLDVQPASVELATRNIEAWGLAERFDVRQGDLREADLGDPYNVVFLINNIYYFAPEERPALFRRLRELVGEGGTLLLVSMFHGSNPTALALDLVLASTKGCYALPKAEWLEPELREAGFSSVRFDQLMAGQSLIALRAS